MKIRTISQNQDFNQAFDYLANIYGVRQIGSKMCIWIDTLPAFPRSATERKKMWANIMEAVITVNVLAERGSVEMTRQPDYQGRPLGFFVDEKLLEIDRSSTPATIEAIKRLTNNGKMNGWGSFKHALMRELGIPAADFSKWDVPQDWIDAFKQYFRR